MRTSYGALKIAANTTPSVAPNTPAAFTTGWAAHGVSQQGDASVTPVAASGKLTLVEGVYRVCASLAFETENISGTSGDDSNDVSFTLYAGGSALSGTKRSVNQQALDRPACVQTEDIVEITSAMVDAGTNYVQLYSSSGASNGTDITVTNGILSALRLS